MGVLQVAAELVAILAVVVPSSLWVKKRADRWLAKLRADREKKQMRIAEIETRLDALTQAFDELRHERVSAALEQSWTTRETLSLWGEQVVLTRALLDVARRLSEDDAVAAELVNGATDQVPKLNDHIAEVRLMAKYSPSTRYSETPRFSEIEVDKDDELDDELDDATNDEA